MNRRSELRWPARARLVVVMLIVSLLCLGNQGCLSAWQMGANQKEITIATAVEAGLGVGVGLGFNYCSSDTEECQDNRERRLPENIGLGLVSVFVLDVIVAYVILTTDKDSD